MKETKFVKAYCKKARKYFGLEVKKCGEIWKVVNMDSLSDEDASLVASEVRQDTFDTNDNLLPCAGCGSRRVGGCACATKKHTCSPRAGYYFGCVYCKNFEIDYSIPSRADMASVKGKTITVQGKEVKAVTFSNVRWEKFDNVVYHVSGKLEGYLLEPLVHVVAKQKKIEFHGYNVSQMDEGVYYVIGRKDDFEIECRVDTSGIQPHPGGYLYIQFGAITAQIDQNGGSFYLDGQEVAGVGARFHMRLSLTEEGKYEIFIDGVSRGRKIRPTQSEQRVTFGFRHEGHHCKLLSHAKLTDIKMTQGVAKQ